MGALAVCGGESLQATEIAAALCLAASFFCGVFARAFTAFSRARLEALIGRSGPIRRGEGLERLGPREKELAQAASMGRDIFGGIVGILAVARVYAAGGAPQWHVAAAWLAAWLVGAELLSRIVGTSFAEPLVVRLGRFAKFILLPLVPLGKFVFAASRILDRLRGVETQTSGEKELQEEIRAIVQEGTTEGVLRPGEGEMIQSVLRMRDADVAEIMTPRTDMVLLPIDMNLADAIRVAAEAGHSRLPVYEGTRDNIVGIFYVKDLLKYWGANPPPALRDLLRKPYFIPESGKVSGLLEELRRANVHIAIVLDEYGGTAGLVTIEDIVEEIVGDIKDEFDRKKEPSWQRIGEGVVDSDARVHVDDINEALGLSLPEAEDYDTIGGYVLSVLGRIPKAGEKFSSGGAEFEVLDADARRIKRLRIRRLV